MVSERLREAARLHRRSRRCRSRAVDDGSSVASNDAESVLSDCESCAEGLCRRRRRVCDCADCRDMQSRHHHHRGAYGNYNVPAHVHGGPLVITSPYAPSHAPAVLTWPSRCVAVPHWADIPSCTPERVVMHCKPMPVCAPVWTYPPPAAWGVPRGQGTFYQ